MAAYLHVYWTFKILNGPAHCVAFFCHTFRFITTETRSQVENWLILKFEGDCVLSACLQYPVGPINMLKHASQTGSAA